MRILCRLIVTRYRVNVIRDKVYKTTCTKVLWCLPSPLQSNVNCNEVAVLLLCGSFSCQHALLVMKGKAIT